MLNIKNFIIQIIFHYRRFGIKGILFFLKVNFTKKKLLKIELKEIGSPIYLRNNTSDIDAFYDIFVEKEYNISLPFKPKTIIDCGANIGLATVYFKSIFPDAKIISIEPELSNFELLKKNTEALSNVICLNYGIWNKSAILEIQDVGLGKWGFITNEVETENDFTIKAVSIDEIIQNFNLDVVDILKIDVEGSEKEIFNENFQQWLSKVRVLIVELHDHMRSGCSESFYEAIRHYEYDLKPHGNNMVCYIKNLQTDQTKFLNLK